MMKRSLITLALCVLILATAALPAICEQPSFWGLSDLFQQIKDQTKDAPTEAVTESTTVYVEIDVKDQGKIVLELYPDTAPITVENFLKLVDQKFYDGLTFHRIINGFMAQGGCPLGNGTGGSGTNIKGEFSQNGVENPLKHTRGVISMARSSNPNSASSQFFIMHQDAPHLDGAYAAFGKVVSGMEVVDSLCQNTPVVDRNGTVHPAYKPVILSIRRVENN